MTEMTSELDHARHRLRALGATPDEVATFVDGWDDFTDPDVWSPEIRAAWLRSSDDAVMTELTAIRTEHRLHTTDETDDALDVLVAAEDLLDVAETVCGGNIADVLTWVGDDVARAVAALHVELGGQSRTTLVPALETIAGDHRL